MNRTAFLHCSATLLILAGVTATTLCAADDPAPPPGRPSREELREKLKGLTPAERQARLRDLREKAGTGALGEDAQKRLAEFQKFRESVRNLPPAEREAKIREWREKNRILPLRQSAMPLEERERLRANFSERIHDHIQALKKKQTDGTLTEMESRRLQHMKQMAARLESRGDRGGKGGTGGPGLPPPRSAKKPASPAAGK